MQTVGSVESRGAGSERAAAGAGAPVAIAPSATPAPGVSSGIALRARRGWERRHPILVALLVLAIAAGAWWGTRALLPVSVTATTVTRADLVRTLVLTGRVRPPSRAGLGASIAGTARLVLAREGERVWRGETLVVLDDAQPRAALAQARAALAEAEAGARSAVEQAELAAAQAARDLERTRSLYEGGAVSLRTLEEAQRAATVARSQLDAARASVGDGAPGAPAPALATIERARAVVAAARAQLALTRVAAPADGIVLGRDVEPGDAVQPGRTLLDVALDAPTEIAVFPREENLADLQPGAMALASADAYPAERFPARVAWISPAVDPSQGTVEVRLVVPDPPPYLRADMTVSLELEAARRRGVLVVPLDAVRDLRSGAPWVAVARDGRAERRVVRLGLQGSGSAEVLGGLSAGERVLPSGIAPGRRVRLTRSR